MTVYVWASSENHAIERAYDCQDYKDLAEALRKKPREGAHGLLELYVIEVYKVVFEALIAPIDQGVLG